MNYLLIIDYYFIKGARILVEQKWSLSTHIGPMGV